MSYEAFRELCAKWAEAEILELTDNEDLADSIYKRVINLPLPEVKQEPVAWLYHDAPSLDIFLRNKSDAHLIYSIGLSLARKPNCRNETALYAAPPDADAIRKENEQLHQLITDLELKSKLAPDHNAMRVDYSGLLGQCARVLKRSNSGDAEMLRQLKGHLQELGQRFYDGDIAAVDEFLQLYCIESDLRLKLKGGAA